MTRILQRHNNTSKKLTILVLNEVSWNFANNNQKLERKIFQFKILNN